MSEIMLASEMTDGQIDDLANKLRDAARKHRTEFDKSSAQEALRSPNIGMQLLAVFRDLVEDISKQIARIVTVNRARTPQESLDAYGRKQYTTKAVVDAMPRGSREEMKIVYFKPDKSAYKNGCLSCQALDDEYKKRGLVPDPQAQIDDNSANPEFADTTPNACQWKDDDGNWCYATFGRWGGVRYVGVGRRDDGWDGDWVFAGVSAS
ncbi:hypothetical protein N8083_00815 [Candidatus Pacebacteria bacterium]|nr:hypothetical protein [Candidatus Paceibacterota bacterium]